MTIRTRTDAERTACPAWGRYLHPDVHKATAAGAALSAHLGVLLAPRSLPSPIAVTR
ncbi:hypothetical protein [Streptomyces antibioticus]|uniref:hypothetical protein n=1 Tax=Streptomyces antibioticus TaxID=1890 RepID=UPI00225BA677|nr:hypothetical protein [Streptomyces antibioticus]MCX5172684.1 hypothetical protein [Streptomyces antibioticus]